MSRDGGQDLEALDDEELFLRWIASRRDRVGSATPFGDERAYGLLWQRHHETSLRIIQRRLGPANRRMAEEVNQDAWAEVVRAFSWAPHPRRKHAFASWLGTVARNKARDAAHRLYLDAERPLPEDEDDLVRGEPRPILEPLEAQLDRARRVEACRRAASTLTTAQAEVLDLYATRDLDADEIAEHLGLPCHVVRSRLAHAKRNLKRRVNLG